MWPWTKPWRDWAMHELLPLPRLGLRPQALHPGYEKAGLTVPGPVVPWNAEALILEAVLGASAAGRRQSDFTLRLPGREPVPPESLRRGGADGLHRLFFRAPPPEQNCTAEVFWKDRCLDRVSLQRLSAEEFFAGLRLQLPTVSVRLGGRAVACQTFVASQCRGVILSAVLSSPHPLAPLADAGLKVELRCERDGDRTHESEVVLTGNQLSGRQALVTATPARFPRRIGTWSVNWSAGGRPLATGRLRAIGRRTFERSLRVTDTRFVMETADGLRVKRQPSSDDVYLRAGPCFFVTSCEPGVAGVCRMTVTASGSASAATAVDVMIGDGPTVIAPGTVARADMASVSGFELRLAGRVVGSLHLCPVPRAQLNAEGGFKPPPEFTWSSAAEDELGERLSRLLDAGR